MKNEEKGQTSQPRVSDYGEEAWASKMWAVYIAEADKYDKALVDSWKSDMEGLVIFAALFSAILTAFIIESYRSLSPDSGDLTVRLLDKISLQIAASANGSAFQETPPGCTTPFSPPATSLICNVLWFISLGLSLACALVATLVQQWARDFLHRADMYSAPLVRARIFSFLYYGLKNFRMHTVVEILPLLLHTSLLLFFAGLVAFFLPVNIIMTAVAASLLLIIGVVYSVLTFLPLRYLDCPYRTPLSGAFWTIWKAFRVLWKRQHSMSFSAAALEHAPVATSGSIVNAVAHAATKSSDEQSDRDYRALVWTLKSAISDVEFEPFVEAMPHLLWGPRGRRHAYEGQIRRLAYNSDVRLQSRVIDLLKSCDSGTLLADARQRRRIVTLKALWALGSIATPTQSVAESDLAIRFDTSLPMYLNEADLPGLKLFDPKTPEIRHVLASAWALTRWRTFCAVSGRLIDLRRTLTACEDEVTKGRTPDLMSLGIISTVKHLGVECLKIRPRDLPELAAPSLPLFQRLITRWLDGLPYKILFEFLCQSAVSESRRMNETLQTLAIDSSVDFSVFKPDLEPALHRAIYSEVGMSMATADVNDLLRFDESVSSLLSYWKPHDNTVPIPGAIIYLVHEHPRLHEILNNGGNIELYLWSNFPAMILGSLMSLESALTAMWRLASCRPKHTPRLLRVSHFEAVLQALSNTGPQSSPIASAIVALVKYRILDIHNLHDHVLSRIPPTGIHNTDPSPSESRTFTLNTLTRSAGGLTGHVLSAFHLPVFPADTAIPFPEEPVVVGGNPTSRRLVDVDWEGYEECFRHRKAEARLVVLVEFLEHCHADASCHKPLETLKLINKPARAAAIHHAHQTRLAKVIHAILSAGRSEALKNAIPWLNCWLDYVVAAEMENDSGLGLSQNNYRPSDLVPWVDNPDARMEISSSLAAYEKRLASSANQDVATTVQIRKILRGLDCLHSESHSMDGGVT